MTSAREDLLFSAAQRYVANRSDPANLDTLCVCALNYKLGELSDKLDSLSPFERINVVEKMNLIDRLLYHALQLTFDARLEIVYGCPGGGKGLI